MPEQAAANARIKHLEFIQGVISRLADNSFRMKGWSVVLVSALLVLVASERRTGAVLIGVVPVVETALIGMVPVVMFWSLDSYFLWKERQYRALYDHVRTLAHNDVDFNMDTDMLERARSLSCWEAFFSRTLLGFYGMLAAFVIGVSIIIH